MIDFTIFSPHCLKSPNDLLFMYILGLFLGDSLMELKSQKGEKKLHKISLALARGMDLEYFRSFSPWTEEESPSYGKEYRNRC